MSLKIIGYRGISNGNKVLIRGQVFKGHKLKNPRLQDSKFQNLRQSINRFRLQPWGEVALRLEIGSHTSTVSTDSSGYFEVQIAHPSQIKGWHPYRLEQQEHGASFEGEYYVDLSPSTAIISDIDDTILLSYATKWWKKLYLVLFHNATSRQLFSGLQTAFEELDQLDGTEIENPFFYVSSSEWNLYDFLVDFFDFHSLPKGPFFLKPLKTRFWELMKSGGGSHRKKEESILFLLDFFPEKKFYLMGDSGQRDPEIYLEICLRHPHRIAAVLIKQAGKRPANKKLDKLQKGLLECQIPFITFKEYPESIELIKKL